MFEPQLAASIYTPDIDGLLSGPISTILAAIGPASGIRFWGFRHRRRGEHLKLRIHCRESQVQSIRHLIEERVEAWFAQIAPGHGQVSASALREPEFGRFSDVPVDTEDTINEDAPVHSLAWRDYRHSAVAFGGGPFLSDVECLEGMIQVHQASFHWIVSRFQFNCAASMERTHKWHTLAGLLGCALRTARFGEGKTRQYLDYHCAWLQRFLAVTKAKPLDLSTAKWALEADSLKPRHPTYERVYEDVWQGTLGMLLDYLRGVPVPDAYLIDPHTNEILFAPLFKILHLSANLAGFSVIEEAVLVHEIGGLYLRSAFVGEPDDGD